MVATGFGPFSPRSGFALDARGFRNLGLTKRDARRRVLALGLIEYAVLAVATFACALYLFLSALPPRPVSCRLGSSVCHWEPSSSCAAVLPPGRPPRQLVVAHPTAARRHGAHPWLVRSWPGGPLALMGMSVYWAADIAALAACMAVFTHRHPVGPALVVGYATGYALTRRSLPLAGPERSKPSCRLRSAGSATRSPRPFWPSSPTVSSTCGSR